MSRQSNGHVRKGETIVPFYRVGLGEEEIAEVVETLRSGWLTTGPRAAGFEAAFAERIGASHAIALNSCTAALHLAVDALGLNPDQGVLVPTMTFGATAEVVRYQGATPIFVDCDPCTLNMDLEDAARKADALERGAMRSKEGKPLKLAGMIPVHVGGLMMSVKDVSAFARSRSLWIVEDAAHAFPAAWRDAPDSPWVRCGEATADVTCFSFYANKTITTGEGGMAVTESEELAERMRIMSLHGISKDAWKRYTASGSWYYEIVAAGFKYNMTDIAAAIGLHQLSRADEMRLQREAIADLYDDLLRECHAVELPPRIPGRVHSRHLYYLRLRLETLKIDRAAFIEQMKQRGVVCSVHWMPLHLHPYYRDTYGLKPEQLPNATAVWPRLVSLPIFPGMREGEVRQAAKSVLEICDKHGK